MLNPNERLLTHDRFPHFARHTREDTLTYTTDGYDVNEPCVLGVGDEYAQTTCCRCSTAVECDAAPP